MMIWEERVQNKIVKKKGSSSLLEQICKGEHLLDPLSVSLSFYRHLAVNKLQPETAKLP